MSRWFLMLAIWIGGCAYVTKSDFDDLWDQDGDGWGAEEDCDDNNPNIHPHAPDVRGDGCDADCGREADEDGDDWPDDVDCGPDDPEVFPCNIDEIAGDELDQDCDGLTGVRGSACNAAGDAYRPEWGLDPDYRPVSTAVHERIQQAIGEDECGFRSTNAQLSDE